MAPSRRLGVDSAPLAVSAPSRPWPPPPPALAGFTLIEVVVALGILAFVVLTFLGTRTDALIDASEARNWRLAREVAEQVLSELEAGARETPPDGQQVQLEEPNGFSYQILVGEASISDHEANQADWDVRSDDVRGDRMAWQRERDAMRRASQKGMTLAQYRDQQLREETDISRDDEVPSEDEFEEVMVIVYFPDVRPTEDSSGESTYKLRAKLSTLAIEGLTPEEADSLASARGLQPENAPKAEEGQ